MSIDEYTEEEMQELECLHGDAQYQIIERAKYIKNMEAESAAIASAIDDMTTREVALQKKITTQRERLVGYMQQCSLQEVTSPFFNIKWSRNRASTEIIDTALIPEKFKSFTTPKPVEYIDKNSIKIAIENEEEVPGARLIYKTKVDIK